MILICAVFGGLIVYSLGFWRGMLAIALGNVVLMLYVGALSFLAGRTGKNFALTAAETFGRRGYVVPAGSAHRHPRRHRRAASGGRNLVIL